MQNYRTLIASLTLSLLSLLFGCGGGSNTSIPPVAAIDAQKPELIIAPAR
jgi:hypothetical protein